MLSTMSCGVIVVALTLLLTADTVSQSSPQSSIRLVNNGYEGIVVAITPLLNDSHSRAAITRIKVGIKCVAQCHSIQKNSAKIWFDNFLLYI